MTLAASGTLEAGAKVKYLITIVRGEAFLQFDLLSDDVGSIHLEKYPVDFQLKKDVKPICS